MQVVKKANEYTIMKKRSGRHAVLNNKDQKFVKGEEKTKILLKEGLIKLSTPKKKEEAPAAAAQA